MRAPDMPDDEPARLDELRSLDLLDTEPDERFDRVTRLAQRMFRVPIALVSLVDDDRQWFKSNQGLDATETPRDVSFCGHAILDDAVMEVCDTTIDPRFADNPLVTGDPGIRFYAGCPISGPGGAKIRTLCIIDREARSLSSDEVESLRDLAGMIEREISAVRLATIDELTGLTNRRGFELLGPKILDVCRRQILGATLLYVDLARFKSINDEFGHEAGDAALGDFARILEDTFRTSDLIARLGGDEFAVLLTQAGPDGPVSRLLDALEAWNRTSLRPYRLAASIGTAAFDPTGDEAIEQLVSRADAEMYLHKRGAVASDGRS